MKKLIPLFLLIAFTFVSCQKDPDSGKLDNNFVALTEKVPKVNFSDYTTFYIADSISTDAGINQNSNHWMTEGIQDEILDEIENTFIKRGFTPSSDKDSAELGVQVTFMEDSHYYLGNNGYWGGYPGYWGYWGGYWGYPGYGGYYPGGYWGGFPLMYNMRVGILVMEVVDLTNATDKNIPVIWTAWMGGMLYNQKFNQAACLDAIQQCFKQSPYFKK